MATAETQLLPLPAAGLELGVTAPPLLPALCLGRGMPGMLPSLDGLQGGPLAGSQTGALAAVCRWQVDARGGRTDRRPVTEMRLALGIRPAVGLAGIYRTGEQPLQQAYTDESGLQQGHWITTDR